LHGTQVRINKWPSEARGVKLCFKKMFKDDPTFVTSRTYLVLVELNPWVQGSLRPVRYWVPGFRGADKSFVVVLLLLRTSGLYDSLLVMNQLKVK